MLPHPSLPDPNHIAYTPLFVGLLVFCVDSQPTSIKEGVKNGDRESIEPIEDVIRITSCAITFDVVSLDLSIENTLAERAFKT